MTDRRAWLTHITTVDKRPVSDLEWLALEFIAFNLRDEDRQEIMNNLPIRNNLYLCQTVMSAVAEKGVGWTVGFRGRPALAFGTFEQWPGNWQVFLFGTNDFQKALVAVKPLYERAVNHARTNGGRRLECRSHSDHTAAHRLLRILGWQCEGVLRRYGADGADYLQFAKLIRTTNATLPVTSKPTMQGAAMAAPLL